MRIDRIFIQPYLVFIFNGLIDFHWKTGSRLANISKILERYISNKVIFSNYVLTTHCKQPMTKKISSLQKPQKQFASNPNLTITRGKVIIFMRGQSVFYYIFINGERTKRNFVKTIYYFHPLFLI